VSRASHAALSVEALYSPAPHATHPSAASIDVAEKLQEVSEQISFHSVEIGLSTL
jgi:hypothetical protein